MRKIITIDCHYLHPQFAAAFLLIDGEQALFVENNTSHSVPLLLKALEREGLKPQDVHYAIITHVHLDHAGGSSTLLKACPNAILLAHPRAVKHIVDPTKLVASARQVYGDVEYERLYGAIEPIDSGRVRAMEDGETLQFGSGSLQFIHTRGHANHHFVVYDDVLKSVFTGDAFGLAYPALQTHDLFIFPSTSPTEFDSAEAVKSVEKIVATGATTAYLTHFGPITRLNEAKNELIAHLKYAEELLTEAQRSFARDEDLESMIEPKLREFFAERMTAKGLRPTRADWDLIKLDLELNAAGLAHVARKRRHGK
jgi:glyoxylase-like metal-dependent hydrolase (beta-lactamase superfamily II)